MKCCQRMAVGECGAECFESLVVCYEHASKESLAQLARNVIRELDQALTDLEREREVCASLARGR